MLKIVRPMLALIRSSVLLLLACGPWKSAQALPSFAEQTGLACNICHTQSFGPNLTSYGRQFKLRGYVDGGGSHPLKAPLAAMARGSFTHTDAGISGGPAQGYGDQDNFAFDEASIFLAGRLAPKLGIFTQLTYDDVASVVALDNTDLRYADAANLKGVELEYGVTLNNAPTVQDPWNTTPVWGYPSASSPLAPTPGAAALVDGGLDGQVAGVTAYVLVNDILYVEGGGYRRLSKGVQNALGTFDSGQNELRGTAPYWRLTLQNTDAGWAGHYVALGTFGMHAEVRPGRATGIGTDTVTDIGADLTYQYSTDPRHIFEAKALYIWEDARLPATGLAGGASNGSDRLNTFRINGSYTWNQTLSLTAAYNGLWGSSDALRYVASPIDGSRTGSPDSDSYSIELAWVPFGKSGSYLAPYYNVRTALMYTGYTKFNGAKHNYDGNGRDASDNNTLLLNIWFFM